MTFPELRPRAPFAGMAIAAALGIALADRWATAVAWDLAAACILAGFTILRPRTICCWLFTATAFFTLHNIHDREGESRTLAAKFTGAPRVVKVTGIVADEPQKPKKWSRYTTCHFPLKLERIEIGSASAPTAITMQIRWAGPPPVYGDRVSILGSASNLAPPGNPGEFDLAGHLRRHGIDTEVRSIYASDCEILGHDCGNPVWASTLRSRHWIQEQLALDLGDSPEISAVISSVVLGMRNDTPESVRTLSQETGTVHLFAVSGLNVAMLAGFFHLILQIMGASRRTSALVTILLLVGYAFVTGLATSTVRATIMATVMLGGTLFDRPAVTYNSFGAAALLILAVDTNQLFSVGFQFSFGVVFFVIWLSGKFHRRMAQMGNPDPFLPRPLWRWPQHVQACIWTHLTNLVAVSIAAWLGSLLFSAGYFHIFSLGSIVANVVAVPAAWAVLALGVASAVVALVSPTIAVLVNNVNWVCAKILLWVLTFSAHLPGSYLYVEQPHLQHHGCELNVLDVGAGGATHLRVDSTDWLIDCGHSYEYEHVVLPYLHSRGVNEIGGLVLTVGNVQHIGSAMSVFDDLRPRVIAESPLKDRSAARREFHRKLEERNFGKRFIQRGDVIDFTPNARLRVLFPPAGLQKSAAEDKALVLMFEAEGERALLMSSSGFSTEQWLLQNEPDLAANILVKNQRAKDVSGTIDFIAKVRPQLVICGPPAPASAGALDSWAESLRASGCTVFRQDQTGAVQVTLRSGEMSASGFLNGQSLRSRAR